MTTHASPQVEEEEPLAGDWLADDDAPLPPPRPRKRLTPLTGGLLAVLLVAGGFVGGVLVQKHEGDGGAGGGGFPGGAFPGAAVANRGAADANSGPAGASGGAAVANRGAADANGGPADANGGAAATVGEVVTVRGDTLYVRDASGATVKVTAQKGATVTRTVDAEPREIRPGEQVVVQGANRNGTVRATSIVAGDATAGLSALMAGGFGGAPGAAQTAARGSAPSGGDAVDDLFKDNGSR